MKVGAMGVANGGLFSTIFFGEDGVIMMHSELSVRISFGGSHTAALRTIYPGEIGAKGGPNGPLDSTGQIVFLASPTFLQNARPDHK